MADPRKVSPWSRPAESRCRASSRRYRSRSESARREDPLAPTVADKVIEFSAKEEAEQNDHASVENGLLTYTNILVIFILTHYRIRPRSAMLLLRQDIAASLHTYVQYTVYDINK